MLEKTKERKFVIMDGSDKNFIKAVISIVEMVTNRLHWYQKLSRRIRCRALDKNHPTMKVITVRSNYRQFDELRKILTRVYPAQCVFDVEL